jgi:hypothetical protein
MTADVSNDNGLPITTTTQAKVEGLITMCAGIQADDEPLGAASGREAKITARLVVISNKERAPSDQSSSCHSGREEDPSSSKCFFTTICRYT